MPAGGWPAPSPNGGADRGNCHESPHRLRDIPQAKPHGLRVIQVAGLDHDDLIWASTKALAIGANVND